MARGCGTGIGHSGRPLLLGHSVRGYSADMMIAENEHVDLAVSGAAMGLMVAFAGGLVIVALLVWAVRLGIKVRQREPAPPRPDEQPRLPESGPVGEIREQRERPRWNEGTGGS